MLPPNYRIRLVAPTDYDAIIEICKLVYPSEEPYTAEELEDHRQVFPQGQFVAIEETRNAVAGVHFTLRLSLMDFHIDDPWDILTAGGTFLDHNPQGPTLYGADIMVHPGHQHHGIAHALTDQARFLVQEEKLWRMVGASRLPGFGKYCSTMAIEDYVAAVLSGKLFDPVLSYTYESEIARYTYADLPDHIDYVVITHNHQDHILLETLLQFLRRRLVTP